MYNIDALCFCAGSPSAPGLFSHLFRFIIDRYYCLLNISIKFVLLHEHKAICVPHIEPHSVWLQLISINACCQISFRPIWCWQISLVLFLMRCAFRLHDNKKDTRCTVVTPTCVSSRICVCALRSRADTLCAQMMHTKSSQCATCTLLHYVKWNIWCEVSHSQNEMNLTLRANLSA